MTALRCYLTGKLHGITVTGASVDYHGSVSIDPDLMAKAGIGHGEQVHVVNLNSGARWITYALKAGPGEFTLNGGSARLGVPGDPCVIMAYTLAETAPGADVVFLGPGNEVTGRATYPGLTR